MKKSLGPIGLDVTSRQIRAAQLIRSAGRWRIHASACWDRIVPNAPMDPCEFSRLSRELSEHGFGGRSIVLAVPDNQLMTGILELPPRASGAPIEQLGRAELARMHGCDPQSFEAACWDLPAPAKAANSTFVMAAACLHEDAAVLLDLFEQEGFDVLGMDTRAWAMARACAPLLKDVSGTGAILHIGWDSSMLTLLHQQTVVYERKGSQGGLEALADSLMEQLGQPAAQVEDIIRRCGLGGGDANQADPPDSRIQPLMLACFDAMVKEMRVPLSYLHNQYPDAEMQHMILIDDGATIPGLQDYLASAFEFDIRVAMPTDLLACEESCDRQYGSSLTVAIGLGQYTGGTS